MKKYIVEVKEILTKEVRVFAESEEEALKKVEDMYEGEKIVLDYEAYKETDFRIIKV